MNMPVAGLFEALTVFSPILAIIYKKEYLIRIPLPVHCTANS
jgi:hypothetical protein